MGTLILSWGTLLMVKQQNWPERAVRIGKVLTNFLSDAGVKKTSVKGLHSLIYVNKSDPGGHSFGVMPAAAGQKELRWLPVMDPVMESTAELEKQVFGPESQFYRKQLAKYLEENNRDL